MSGKGDKQRHVLLGESSWSVLSAIRENASADDFVFRSRQEVSRDGYYKGTRLDITTVFRIVREAAKVVIGYRKDNCMRLQKYGMN